ncbi:response regulator [Lachnospiraceae bacterium 54-53]
MKNKLKLFIVDDETYIRNLLKLSIDWEAEGIEICGESSCAEEGLQLVEELQPNIIFSDICMDYMDGIQFSQKVKERYPYMKIVLLSGHNEFEYASRGIEAGVSAYLLKPIEETRILAVLQKIKEDIYHEQTKEAEIEYLKNYFKDSREFLIENNLNALLLSSSSIGDIMKRLDYLSVNFTNPHFQIALFCLYPGDQPGTEGEDNPYLLSMECRRILKNLLEKYEDMYLFFDFNHRNVVLSNSPSAPFLNIMEEAKVLLLEQLSASVTIGIGTAVNTLSKIRLSYQNAVDASNCRTILGNNQVIFYDYIRIEKQEGAFNLEDAIAALLEAVRSEDIAGAHSLVRSYITNRLTEDLSDIIPIRIAVSTIINHLSELLIRSGLRDTDCFRYTLAAYERLFRLETADELKNMLNNLIKSIIETFSAIRTEKNSNTIHSILAYIDQNYENPDLSLTSVADKFYLNASYLSRLFKVETNTTFTKHLTDLRLKKAADLLLTTQLRSYEISEKVGFRDAKYFSSCFRKNYGMTSNQYRTGTGGQG